MSNENMDMEAEIIQDHFDKMVRGLAGQGWQKSVEAGSGYCQFRGANGMKCAIGHVVPDDVLQSPNLLRITNWLTNSEYRLKSFEGDFYYVAKEMSLMRFGYLMQFWTKAQLAHDNAFSENSMKIRLEDLATVYGLIWPVDVPRLKDETESEMRSENNG